MEWIKLGWGWELVALLAILAIFICTVCFDMIANWDKRKREDMNVLLMGVGIYTLVVLLFTTKNEIALFTSIALITLVTAGHVATTNQFNSNNKPWELWFMAFLSLAGLIGAAIWAYYYTRAGRYISKKGGEMKQKMKDKMAQRRLRMRQRAKQNNNAFELEEMMGGDYDNNAF